MRELAHRYIPGDHYLICDECGLRYRRSQMLERWDGFWVCASDWEPRHPQEFVVGRADRITVDVSRVEYVDMTIDPLELLEGLELLDDLELVEGAQPINPLEMLDNLQMLNNLEMW